METKKCKYCQADIPKKAKVCPNCKKKQGGIGKWIIIAIVIIIIIAIAGGGKSDKDKVADVTTTENVNNTREDSKKQSTEKTEFSIGEVAEYKDVQVSVLNYEESTGNDWGTPEDGKVFVFANVEITNNSDEEISVSSMLSFDAYCDDYKLDFSSDALMAASTDNRQQMDGSIAPGKKLNGYLGFEVPADWSTIEINYKDNAWLSSNFKFIITK